MWIQKGLYYRATKLHMKSFDRGSCTRSISGATSQQESRRGTHHGPK